MTTATTTLKSLASMSSMTNDGFDQNVSDNDEKQAIASMAATSPTVVAATAVVPMTATVEMEEEDDKKGFPLSKQVGVVLERENEIFLKRK